MPNNKFWGKVPRKIKFLNSTVDSVNPLLINFFKENANVASKTTIDIPSLDLPAGDHTIMVAAKAKGYETSGQSNEESFGVINAPVISLNGDTLSWEGVEGATKYSLYYYHLQSHAYTQTKDYTAETRSALLTNVSSLNRAGRYKLVLTASSSNSTSSFSNAVIYDKGLMPIKGAYLYIDGFDTPRQHFGGAVDYSYTGLVTRISNGVAEILNVDDNFNPELEYVGEQKMYAGSNIDAYLNGTLYNSLGACFKSAIIDKTIYQDSWYSETANPSGNPIYEAVGNPNYGNYMLSLGNAEYGGEITRHIYAPSVQDIIDYLDATPEMTVENTSIRFENLDHLLNAGIMDTFSVWTRSANASSNDFQGLIGYDEAKGALVAFEELYYAEGMLQVDLSTPNLLWQVS